MSDIATRIVSLRKQKKYSQEELAKSIDVSLSIIGKYERGINQPSIESLAKMANVFDVSIDYLVGKGAFAKIDKDVLKRLEQIQGLPAVEKDRILLTLDDLIKASIVRGI